MCASVRILGNLRGEWVSESFLCLLNRCSFLRFLSGFEVEFGCQCQEIAYHGGLESIIFSCVPTFYICGRQQLSQSKVCPFCESAPAFSLNGDNNVHVNLKAGTTTLRVERNESSSAVDELPLFPDIYPDIYIYIGYMCVYIYIYYKCVYIYIIVEQVETGSSCGYGFPRVLCGSSTMDGTAACGAKGVGFQGATGMSLGNEGQVWTSGLKTVIEMFRTC